MNKKTYALMLGVALFLVVGAAGTVNAQIPDNEILKAQIPFSFVVRDRTFPAGEYTIRQTPEGADSEFVLELASDQGKARSALIETFSVVAKETPRNSTIQFDKIGDKYFLSKVFVADSPEGNEIPKSEMEKKMAKHAIAENYVLKVEHRSVQEKVRPAGSRGEK